MVVRWRLLDQPQPQSLPLSSPLLALRNNSKVSVVLKEESFITKDKVRYSVSFQCCLGQNY